MSQPDGGASKEHAAPTVEDGLLMRGAALVDGHPTETITLSCGHRLMHCAVRHPLLVPGSSMRCPACTIPRTILRVTSSPAPSGPSCWHPEKSTRHKILIFDDAEGF